MARQSQANEHNRIRRAEQTHGATGGKLIFSIFGALAEFERNLIRERTQVGLAQLGPEVAPGAGHRR